MKNFLLKFLGIDKMHSELLQSLDRVEEKVANQLDNCEDNIRRTYLEDTKYELEQLVSDEVDDRLYNYDLDDMQSSINDLKEDMNDFDHQVSAMAERVEALAEKLDTLSILDRLSALEEKLND